MDILKNPEFMMKENQSSYEYTVYEEDNGGTTANALKNLPVYRITVPASDDMVLMADSFLQVRGQIKTRTTNANYTGGKVALVNCGWNLFDEAKYKINSRIIETVDHPGEVRNVKGLIEYSEDYILGQGQAELFIPDNGDGTNNGDIGVPITSIVAVTANNEISGINTNATGQWRLTVATTNNSAITFHLIDENGPVVIPFNVNDGSIPVLAVNGVTNQVNNAIDTDIADGDVIRFFVTDFSRPLYFLDSNNVYITQAVANATPNLAFENVLANRDIGILQAQQYLGDLAPFSSNFNSGYEQRRLKTVVSGFDASQSFELYMPIRRVFKFMQEHPIMLKGASHILEFKRNNFESMLYTDVLANLTPQEEPVIELNYMSLWVPKIKLTLQYESLYLDSIGDQAVRFEWDTYEWERSEAFNTGSGSHDVATVSGIPKRMYVVFQLASRFDDHTQNNMVYDNLDLQEIYVKLNSQRFPEYEYEINYGLAGQESEKLYMRAYNAYLNACQVTHSDSCKPFVSYDQFKTLYPIYCFDLRSKDTSVFKNGSNIQIKVHWRLRNYNAVPANAYRLTTIYEENVETEIQFLSGNVSKLR